MIHYDFEAKRGIYSLDMWLQDLDFFLWDTS